MMKNEARPGVPVSLWAYIAVVSVGGMSWLVYLVQGAEWGLSATREMGLFMLLVIVAGSFPMRVGPSVKTDVTVAALKSAATLLEPGVAALAGVAGVVTYTALTRFRGERLRLPWYKYPFNAGQISMVVGLSSLAFHTLVKDNILLSWAILPAAVTYYMANTVLVSVAAGLQLGVNPPRIWWKGTKENGSDPEGASDVLAEVRAELRVVQEDDIRRASHELYPYVVNRGLVFAVRSVVDRFAEAIPIEFYVSDELRRREEDDRNRFPEEFRVGVYRIVEEALGNVVKHAQARTARVELRYQGDELIYLDVVDDGLGFETGKAVSAFGFLAMTDYAQGLRGECRIESSPGRGTIVHTTLPVRAMSIRS